MQKTNEKKNSPKTHLLKGFRPTNWRTPRVDLLFDLDPHSTIVRATYDVESVFDPSEALFLHGEGLEFLNLRIGGEPVPPEEYQVTDLGLLLPKPPSSSFQLTVENRISPVANTALEGLYKSGSMLCTQNEPEGFRKIVYSIDRPDNMMVFTVTLLADPNLLPVLLSNGNFVSETLISPDKKQVVWHDPFPKPTYLFCLVAGDLAVRKDSYITKSNREVELRIYVEKGNESKVQFAFESLKKAFEWEEKTFGLEYDLQLFMIVAVSDFNMGAMENKGLNLFNSKLVLCDKKSATDESFESIQAVIGHEYFHNWTGNRVTLQNWFNLTLKEGLTVFRDQWFTEDQTDFAVKRIKDVQLLKDYQFVEDQGPMSHPILPKSYVDMNNFYTVTVYEKGAEVIRLISEIIGRDRFKSGLNKYLSTYDGKGVTYEEFISSMELVFGKEIPNIRNWYHRKGTPRIKIIESYDKSSESYRLDFIDMEPDQIPLPFLNKMALFRASGDLILEEDVLLTKHETTLTYSNLKEKPIVSVFRKFSSPIEVLMDRNLEEEIFLAKYEREGVAKFFSFQKVIFSLFQKSIESKVEEICSPIMEIIRTSLSMDLDLGYLSHYLSFPSVSQIAEALKNTDYETIHSLRYKWMQTIAKEFELEFQELYARNAKNMPNQSKEERDKRKAKNLSLAYLLHLDSDSDGKYLKLTTKQVLDAKHMTEELGALRLICELELSTKEQMLKSFYEKWSSDSIVLDSWFSIQVSYGSETKPILEDLERHTKWNIQNPNKVRALYYSFARNPRSFHKADGSGYQLMADRILRLDPVNPQVAAGLTKLFQSALRMPESLKDLAKKSLERVVASPTLSKEVREVVDLLLK